MNLLVARDNTTPLLVLLGGAVAALLLTKRRSIMLYGAKALEAGKEWVFEKSISDEAQPYAKLILRVARETGVDAFLLYALGQRESRWGEAIGGPGGTGDGGHGRGIMQIDDRSFAQWLAANDWRDPYTNVTKGALILKQKMAFLGTDAAVRGLTDGVFVAVSATQAARRGVEPATLSDMKYRDPRPLVGEKLIRAAIAAYNSGEGNILISLAVGVDIDTTTANGNYFADVWNKMVNAAAAFDRVA